MTTPIDPKTSALIARMWADAGLQANLPPQPDEPCERTSPPGVKIRLLQDIYPKWGGVVVAGVYTLRSEIEGAFVAWSEEYPNVVFCQGDWEYV